MAVVLAYCTGMTVAFVLAKLFVFKSGENETKRAAMIFIFVNLLGVVQTWIVTMGMALYLLPAFKLTWRVEEVAHLLGVLSPVFTSYLGHKYWSFR